MLSREALALFVTRRITEIRKGRSNDLVIVFSDVFVRLTRSRSVILDVIVEICRAKHSTYQKTLNLRTLANIL